MRRATPLLHSTPHVSHGMLCHDFYNITLRENQTAKDKEHVYKQGQKSTPFIQTNVISPKFTLKMFYLKPAFFTTHHSKHNTPELKYMQLSSITVMHSVCTKHDVHIIIFTIPHFTCFIMTYHIINIS